MVLGIGLPCIGQAVFCLGDDKALSNAPRRSPESPESNRLTEMTSKERH
jgi:hypothetical protein